MNLLGGKNSRNKLNCEQEYQQLSLRLRTVELLLDNTQNQLNSKYQKLCEIILIINLIILFLSIFLLLSR
jgi:hypothetical protein